MGSKGRKPGEDEQPAAAPKALDRWFDEALNKLYDDVVNEPVPDDLLQLVRQLQAKKLQ